MSREEWNKALEQKILTMKVQMDYLSHTLIFSCENKKIKEKKKKKKQDG